MKYHTYAYGLLLSFVLICYACTQKTKEAIVIAAASNMQYVLKEITKKFIAQTGIPCELVFSSSGKLTAQIKEGAPYDIFVAANMKYPEELYTKGLTLHKPQTYAYGQLVLWTMYDDIRPDISMLTDKKVKHIAIANPITAPYGTAAIEALKHYNIYDTINNKLVYGESIAQTNQFITSKSANIGFTAKSVVVSSTMKNKGNWITVNDSTYTPIRQGIVRIKRKKDALKKAQQFYDFLFSSEAREILEDFGYLIPK